MEQVEKQTIGSSITSVIVKSRFVIMAVLLTLIVAAIVIGVVLSIGESKVQDGLEALDAIEFRYSSLDPNSDSFTVEQTEILSEASALAQSSSDVVKVRTSMFIADIHFELENWTDARDAYVVAYETDTESYTAPLALYNAAIASEEMGEADKAVEYLTLIKSYEDFTLIARALFNLGRIEDTRGNFQEAAGIYQELNDKYPSTSWANLAMSRIITLKAEGKAE